jgi:hypothetical protein
VTPSARRPFLSTFLQKNMLVLIASLKIIVSITHQEFQALLT